ncbi:chromosome segregation protein SMC [Lacticaseibacillus baoqingensis]|uniref:Chromosome partition protein Smc n=1 Tax=Lacticaseibacillus baoqingensis TaxID=2486013 RepID=A0ABW4E515_9LACO|nr:chromosome segregation protein SMC [Lacticaseibacillus baoqingensis]
MQLKTLVINGFKSFADKTQIDFVPGLTGIVGPNGSGKSNITEAIRWSLGEQSAKSLRGEKMGDVIFAGTASRPPLNRAEVVMTFDNRDGYLANQPAEVSVTRRLYRDGESDFLINNQAVRLKDIVDLFMDSGLGKESFSFISQGRVEAIFNSKPEERRGILEEAAGVLKYKQQKIKADKELQTTTDNLDRVNDIIQELHRQLTPLEEQASIARDYERQTKDYQNVHQAILALEIQQLDTEQTATAAQAKVTAQLLAGLKNKLATLEARSEALTAKDQEFEQALDTCNDQLLTASTRLESLTGEANLSTERVNHTQLTLADLNQQLDEATQQAAEAAKQLAALADKSKIQAADRKQAQQALQAAVAAAQSPAALQAQLDAAQAQYIDLLQTQAAVNNQLAAAKKDQQVQANQTAAQSTRVKELTKRVAQARQAVEALTAQIAAAQKAATEAQTALAKTRSAADAAQTQYAQTRQRYQEALGIYQSTQSRYETLKELKEDYQGFFAGVKAVLQHKAQLPGVVGAVAELLTVPKQYQQALDIALGGALQSIVTTDEQAAKQAITYLKQQRAGRATFLPISVIKPRHLPQAVLTSLQGQPGFLGVGVELIRYPQQVAGIMANLAGSLIVADTLDHAIALANQTGHRYRIVTVEGDLLNVGGSLSGGQVKAKASSPLARTQEVQTLAAQLKQMTAALTAKQTELDDLQQQATAAAQAVAASQQTLTQQTTAQQALQAQLTARQEALTQLKRQLQALGLDASQNEDFATVITQLQTKAAQITAQLTTVQATIAKRKADLAESSTAEAAKQAQVTDLKTQVAVLKSAQATTKAQTEQWQASLDAANAHASKLKSRIDTLTAALANTDQDQADREQTIKDLQQAQKQLQQKRQQLTQAKAANRGELSQVSGEIATVNRQQNTAMAQSQQQAVSLNRIKLNLDSRLGILAEDYQLSFEAAKAAVVNDETELPMLKSRLKLLKRGLDELGPVNPNAIAEYQEVRERYDFLTKQQADLLAAKDQLQETMGELDEAVKTRFKDMFDATNTAFQAIFPKMFGGGHAHLSLTDPDDLLNTGLEISAQPPGKKLSRLSLLSGGERALTAIVLLFAILQVRPVPFSILDEVEASLDDVNVNRFGQFLKHYASDTQFIVITHRRGTMLAANVLYGVTMQESGVSRMMAVSLDQAVQDNEG